MNRFISIILCSFFFSYAHCSTMIAVSKKNINWKSQITSSYVDLIVENQRYKCKKNIDLDVLKKNKYRAKHFILKNRAICADDVYEESNKKIKFNFGFFEIEKNAELIKETTEYIKIKNADGKIEKIYKNGSEK